MQETRVQTQAESDIMKRLASLHSAALSKCIPEDSYSVGRVFSVKFDIQHHNIVIRCMVDENGTFTFKA